MYSYPHTHVRLYEYSIALERVDAPSHDLSCILTHLCLNAHHFAKVQSQSPRAGPGAAEQEHILSQGKLLQHPLEMGECCLPLSLRHPKVHRH